MKKLTALLLTLICLALTACTAPEEPAPSGAPAETSLAVPEDPTPPPEPGPEPGNDSLTTYIENPDMEGYGIIGHVEGSGSGIIGRVGGSSSEDGAGVIGTQPWDGYISGDEPEPTESPSFYTLEEFKKNVSVFFIKDGVKQGEIPDDTSDMIDIVYASAHKWMENIFTGMAEDYRCTGLELYDVSEDKSVFCYSMRCEFKCEGGEPPQELMAGNTVPADEEGWWRFSRQVRIERDGESWKVADVGTGGINAGE